MKFTKSYEPGEFEPQIYAEWEKTGVFQPRRIVVESYEAETQDCYSVVMPPPNANGNLHIGHGLTIALEDSLVRYNRLRGKSTWYIPGADHAGFETWVVYERALEKQGRTRFEYSRDELYAQVWKFVEEQRGNMELQLRALGASCAWSDLTFTLDENVISRVYQTFEKMWNDGMIYRGEKLVNFCPKHQTAFADIEVEHKDEEGKLWEVAYQLVSVPEDMIDSASDFTKREIVVSTTRPETIFGDTAVAVNPADERYQDMIGGLVKLPLTERVIPIIADEHAEMEYGTGAVKITPAHDFDDFEVGERHGLERIRVIGEDGKMTAAVGEKYAGLTTEECRKQVLEDLEAQGLLRGEKKITHAVAHCYKCGAVIEPMLKAQWFIDVKRLAKAAIEHLERGEIKFHPANKKKVLINYLEGLKDWNISRQIPWGIPIPAFRQTETQDAPEWIFDIRTNLQKIEVGGVHYYRDEDTFDTWFSSSHWPIVCTNWLAGKENPYYPLNVMETGADILFAWVARMIMMGIYVTGEVPFREVYLHGLVLDEHGQKMSKSKGNVINPMDLVTKYGSDAFRLGILRGRSAGMNQAFSENSVMAGRNLCNKLWNISRFIQGMVDESHSGSVVAAEMIQAEAEAEVVNEGAVQAGAELPYSTDNMGEDWICRELTACKDEIEDDMANYRFSEAVETLYSVIWDKYADWFIESQKIYKNVPLLKMTLEMILKMLHPFAPFVTEAIWQSLSWTEGLLIVQKWPTRLVFDAVSAQNFESLMVVVSETRRVSTELSGASKGKKWTLLYGDDSLVDDNQLLLTKLTGVASVISCEGQPQGLRLALVNHEVYLDVPAEIVAEYRDNLEQRILSVGRELDALNLRMMNPNYVDKAPAALVKQTRDGIAEKTALIERLKGELRVIE
jgi:valyl-tRNA synthetase